MNEYSLKYGTNPNQTPARIFMRDDSPLPLEILNGRPGYINFLDALNSWQLVRELRASLNLPAAARQPGGSSTRSPIDGRGTSNLLR